MSDKTLLIISAFIAVAIWLYVFSSENREAVVQIPVQVLETRDNTMASALPKEVSVRVKGPRSMIYSAMASNTTIDINVSEHPLETSVIRLSPNDVRISGVEIIEITPSRIEVSVQSTKKAKVKFQPLMLGQPKKGYKVSSVSITPGTADVEGLPEYVSQLTAIQTKNINIEGIDKTTEYITDPSEYNGIKSIEPRELTIQVEIIENIIEQRIMSRVSCMANTGSRAMEELLPMVEVTAKGRSDILEEINGNARMVEVNCSSLSAVGIHQLIPTAKIYENYEIIKIEPTIIEIETKQ